VLEEAVFTTTDDGCFSYCNITSSYDGLYWGSCLLDNLSASEAAILFANDNDADVRTPISLSSYPEHPIFGVSVSFLLVEGGKHVVVANSSQWTGSNALEAEYGFSWGLVLEGRCGCYGGVCAVSCFAVRDGLRV
jgi:hypothetical protein